MNEPETEKNLKIYITKEVGEGTTRLSAFDNALQKAGIANHNLIYLSSIIPINSEIKIAKPNISEHGYGNKLYTVMARFDQVTIGKEAWAGLGWTQDKEGRGLFVEHWAENKEAVIKLIQNSLNDMKAKRNYKYGKIEYCLAGVRCENKPVCAIVSAVFKIENWQ